MNPLIWISVLSLAVNGLLPGIPDGNDKAYRFVKDKHTYIHLSHVPNSYTIKTTGQLDTQIGVYSHGFSNCLDSFEFTMQTTTTSYNFKGPDGSKTGILITQSVQGASMNRNVIVNDDINSFIAIANNKDYTLTVNTKPAPICHLWLHLGEGVTVTAETPYKPYVQPSDSSTYFVNSGIFPIGFARGAAGLSLDVMLAVVSTYTYYKGVGRPVPSIVVPSSVCTGVVVHMEINNLCKISTEVTPSGYSFTVGANNVMIPRRPTNSYLIFTMTDVYLHMSGPLEIHKLGSCSFGSTFLNDAEFVMKTSYEKPESISCNSWLLTFADDVDLRRPPTTTTLISTTTAAGNDTEEEEETDAPAVASAKTTPIVIGVVGGCVFILLVIIIIIVIVVYCKKKKKRNQAAAAPGPSTVSTADMDISVEQAQGETAALPPMPSNEPEPQPSKEQLAAEAAKEELYKRQAASALMALRRKKSAQSARSAKRALEKLQKPPKLAPKKLQKPPKLAPENLENPLMPPKPPGKPPRILEDRTKVLVPPGMPPEPEIDPDPTTTDYHFMEPEKLQLCLGITEAHTKVFRSPELTNIWEAVVPDATIYLDIWIYAFPERFQANDDVKFKVRDLVAVPQPVFRPLANRILEPGALIGPSKWGDKLLSCRTFVTCHEPFFFEIHFVNKVPGTLAAFAKDILECGWCYKTLYNMSRGQLYNLVSFDDWKTLCCKVKRVPVNHHYVVSVVNPYDPTMVHTVMFIRGDGKDEDIKPCRRKCEIDKSVYHRNTFPLQSEGQYRRGEATEMFPKALRVDQMLRTDSTQKSD
uniref:CUB domain-containing protein n=1 Tax=Panagrellus redivivus TaxID=6233 RepID=A0A7E4UWN3_PANRE